MPRLFHRETFIALRARHEGFRIASDFLWGKKIEVPPPPAPPPVVLPRYDLQPVLYPRRTDPRVLRILLLILLFLLVVLCLQISVAGS